MLYIKDTSMLVAGVAVPGLVKKLEITEAAVIDAVTDDNNVTLGYQPNGYEPLKMNVDLLLEPGAGESVETMVQTIKMLFKSPGQTAAITLPVVNSQAAACGLSLVYFKGINLAKKTENSYEEATLEFWECLPLTVQTQAAGSGKTSSSGSKAGASQAQGISTGYQEYLNTQRGQAPRIKDKTSESPARDT